MAAGTKYFVYADGRWREVETASGRVAGWSGRARFVFARRGRLHLARARRVLAALRALAAGQPAAVRDGPRLSQRRYENIQPVKKRYQHVIADNEHHHCCNGSYTERCNYSTSNITKPHETIKVNTGTQCVDKADASTQALPPATSKKLIIEPKLHIASHTVRPHNRKVKSPSPVASDVPSLKAVPQSTLDRNKSYQTRKKHKRDSSSDDYFKTTKVTLKTTNIKSKPIQDTSSALKRKRSISTSTEESMVVINSKQTAKNKDTDDDEPKRRSRYLSKTKTFKKHRLSESKSSNDCSSYVISHKQSSNSSSDENVSCISKNSSAKHMSIDQELRTGLRSQIKTKPSGKHQRSKSTSSVEDLPKLKTHRRSRSSSSHKNSSQKATKKNSIDKEFKSKLQSPLKTSTIAKRKRRDSKSSSDSQPKLISQRQGNITSSDEFLILSKKSKNKQYDINENSKSNTHSSVVKQKPGPAKRKRRSTSEEIVYRDLPTQQTHFDSQDDKCKELSIDETDIEVLRSFLMKTSRKFDFKRFDNDDEYKRKYFYKINPLVNLERCSAILKMNRETKQEQMNLKDFASKLGLKSVLEATSIPKRYKTRTSNVKEKTYRTNTTDSSNTDDTDKENKKKTDPKKQELKPRPDKILGNTKQFNDKRDRKKAAVTHNKVTNNASKETNNNQIVVITSHANMNQSSASTKSVLNDVRLSSLHSKHSISKRPSSSKAKEYSNLEDHAIVAWVSAGGRARFVNGNKIWCDLQEQYHGLTGQHRTWQSLRNRYLRYILPSLATLSLPPAHVSRLRAAAASGHPNSRKRLARRNSIFDTSGVRGASARVHRAPPATPHLPRAASHSPPATSHSPPATSHSPRAAPHSPRATLHSPRAVQHSSPSVPPSTERTTLTRSSSSPKKRALRSSQRSPSLSSSSSSSSPRVARGPPRRQRESPRYSAVTREFAARHKVRSSPRGSPAVSRPPDRPPTDGPRTRRLYNPKLML